MPLRALTTPTPSEEWETVWIFISKGLAKRLLVPSKTVDLSNRI